MRERKAVTNELAGRYQRSGKRERGRLLAEFIALTGYHRSYASHILHNWGRREVRVVDGERVEIVLGASAQGSPRRRKPRRYDEAVRMILEQLWALGDGVCGKRLRAFIDVSLPALERFGEVVIADGEVRAKLLAISPATMDRLLGPTRERIWEKERSTTKPGTLLKHHIPIRTFADWNESAPGFLEIDLVAHDGGSGYGEYLQTLDATDIATGWTETGGVKNKAQVHVFAALKRLRGQFPFPVLGIDSDNGSEFINNELYRYCVAEEITFTRSRPLRKNDNCYVEQKNYSVVRRVAGYYRYETERQLGVLEEIYRQLRLYSNFFLPVMKLVSKTRSGSKVTKQYDTPQTPFQRVLAHPGVTDQVKAALTAQFEQLNPAELKRTIAKLQSELFDSHCPLPQRPVHHPTALPNHPWRKTDSLNRAIRQGQRMVDSETIKPDTPATSPTALPP